MMFDKLIKKIETYSLNKQFLILFLVATFDVWFVAIIVVVLGVTTLGELSIFRLPPDLMLTGRVFGAYRFYDPLFIHQFF